MDNEYCEDEDRVFNVAMATAAAVHAKDGHHLVRAVCPACDETVCSECLVDAAQIHDVGIEGFCPFCGGHVVWESKMEKTEELVKEVKDIAAELERISFQTLSAYKQVERDVLHRDMQNAKWRVVKVYLNLQNSN